MKLSLRLNIWNKIRQHELNDIIRTRIDKIIIEYYSIFSVFDLQNSNLIDFL